MGRTLKKKVTWDDVIAFALGELGLKPDDFWRMSWREYNLMCLGHNERKHLLYKEQWERLRWQTLYLVNVHMGKKPIRTPQKLLTFPWERSTKPPMTNERFEELKTKWKLN